MLSYLQCHPPDVSKLTGFVVARLSAVFLPCAPQPAFELLVSSPEAVVVQQLSVLELAYDPPLASPHVYVLIRAC